MTAGYTVADHLVDRVAAERVLDQARREPGDAAGLERFRRVVAGPRSVATGLTAVGVRMPANDPPLLAEYASKASQALTAHPRVPHGARRRSELTPRRHVCTPRRPAGERRDELLTSQHAETPVPATVRATSPVVEVLVGVTQDVQALAAR